MVLAVALWQNRVMTEQPVFLPPTFKVPDAAVITADGHRRIEANFAMVAGYRSLQLDVHLPKGEGPFPTVVWIHGGGYSMGDRRSMSPWLEAADLVGKTLAEGIAFVSIEYRLGYEATFPAAVHDANAALRYLARYAKDLQLDTQRIALWGESAGAHLAMLTAYTRGQDFFRGDLGVRADNPLNIRLLLNWFGATDLTTIKRPMDGNNASMPDGFRYTPEYFNLGADRHLDLELRKLASPVNHLAGATMPTVIFHGTADTMVPFQQALALQEALIAAGQSVELHAIEGSEHGWMGQPQDVVNRIVKDSIGQISKHLKG